MLPAYSVLEVASRQHYIFCGHQQARMETSLGRVGQLS